MVVGADGASCRHRVWNTVAVAVDAVSRWNACGAGAAGPLSCFHEFYDPCYWVRSLAPVLYSLRAGLLEFVKGFNPPAALELRRVLTDQSVLLAADAFLDDMIVVSR